MEKCIFVFLAEVFYNVNYVNVNFSDKNSTVDYRYIHIYFFYHIFSLD